MAISVVMPALEMAQETGKLVSWLKKEGEHVAKGEPLLEIETDKAVMEIESPGEGLLAGVSAQPGMEVPVGQTIAWIIQPGETPPAETATAASARRATSDTPAKALAPPSVTAASATDLKISPKARRLAKEQGVDLSQVSGTGPGGEILASDVLAAAQAKSVSATQVVADTSGALSAVGKLMAERTTQSWVSVPHFFLTREVDAEALNQLRTKVGNEIEKSHGVRLSHTDLLIALVARVLVRHPQMNASWAASAIRIISAINVSVAMAVEGGVVAPVIHDADKLDLGQIAAQRRELTDRARSGKLRPADITGGTFTISNLGMFEVDAFTAIITPPQVAILAVGRIAERVVAVDGKPAVRPMMTLTLSSDHRVVDGARAAQFMQAVAQAIAQPAALLG
jgi:pyruvate dehydrogenase E2 component (dihydrolipoamide acetyltransferase)